jgi:putative ABC transport system permease protein
MKRPLGRTYLKTILREIRGSLGRFTAIFGIAALGVGFLAGLLATTPDMKLSMDRYFDQSNMMDITLKATMGFTGEDVRALEALPEVALVQGAYVTDVPVKTAADEILITRIHSLPRDYPAETSLNRPELVSGRLPEGAGECLAQMEGGFLADIPLGSVLTIEAEAGETYARRDFTVMGIVKSPLLVSFEREPSTAGNGRLGALIYVPEGAYTLPVYTDLYLTLRGAAAETAFSREYQDLVDRGAKKIEILGIGRSVLRREELLAGARRQIREGLARGEAAYREAREKALGELARVRGRLDAGEAELAAGEAELAGAGAEIAAGRERLEAERQRAEAELAENAARLLTGEAEIAGAKQTLAEAKARLDEARGEVEKTRASRFRMIFPRAREGVAQYDQGLLAWEEGTALVREKEAELREGRRLLGEGRARAEAEFAAAEAELAAGEAELAAGQRRLEDARRELARGEAAYREGRAGAEAKLREGAEELAEGRRRGEEIDIDLPAWYILDRNANVGAATYRANAEKIDAVAKVFPVFFLLVSALVALTTMTRMVEEERLQIGTLKALGYRKRVIAGKYIVYCGLTGVLGSAAGMTAGFRGLPRIIYNAFGTRYHLPPLVTRFDWTFGLIACSAVLLCVMGATILACYGTLREKPAALLLPRSPRAGKRIFLEYLPFIWRPMKFTYKVTARNLIRHKKHFFMTLTGIAGCTALMTAGFGLRDSMTDIARTQFTEITNHDLRIELQEGKDPDETLGAFLAGTGPGGWAELHSEGAVLINPGARNQGDQRISLTLQVPRRGDTLGNFINLRDRRTRTALEFNDRSAILTEKAASLLGIKPGEIFTLENARGMAGEFTLTGITENYVGSYLYLGKDAYGAVFGGEPRYSTLLLSTGIGEGAEQDAAITRILASESTAAAEFNSHVRESYNRLLSSIDFVVLVLISAAGGLAMIVLYNLTNININERSRELATLRVLGFHRKEAAAYIFREIGILSLLGAAAGLVLGIPLHRFIISVAENPDLMFGRRISPGSFIFSALITLVFSSLVDLLMMGKIRNIKMAESMKAAE